jgi:hypothetical protein
MIRYRHLRNIKISENTKEPYNVITICTDKKSDGKIVYGVSFCSKKDKFNKKIGCQLAFENLENDRSRIVEFSDDKPVHIVIIEDMLNNISIYPHWTKKFLNFYLENTSHRKSWDIWLNKNISKLTDVVNALHKLHLK